MRRDVPRTDVLFALMGAPHSSDMTLTMLRCAHAILDRGGCVSIWTCGYATALTQETLGECKPRNLVDWSREYPTAMRMARELITRDPARVRWYACRFCSEERGASQHVPEVVVRPPMRFGEHVSAAAKSVFLGVV